MKTSMIALIGLMWMNISLSQSFDDPEHVEVSIYEEKEIPPTESQIRIPVDFCYADLKSIIPDSLLSGTILGVDLVYTTWRTNPEFDQERLNDQRYQRFVRSVPSAAGDLVYWRYVGQTAPTTSEEAGELFHGFVVHFRPTPTEESMEKEIALLDELLMAEPLLEETKAPEKVPEANFDTEVIGTVGEEYAEISPIPDLIIGKRDTKEKVMGSYEMDEWSSVHLRGAKCYNVHTMARKTDEEGIKTIIDSLHKVEGFLGSGYSWSKVKKKGERKYYLYNISWAIKSDSCDESTTADVASFPVTTVSTPTWSRGRDYSVVEEVFNRHPQWINSLILLDVTGSMYPYLAQTMAWVKKTQDSEQVDAFVFFNDGNLTPDSRKKIGNVGGIYSSENSDFKAVYGTMKSTMRKGGGGDCPENNVEATIKGVQEYPDCDEVIMVADNWATPRDMSLVSQLNVPVHVIVCGSGNNVNINYVQLAYDTGGSIHTMEQDLEARDIKPGSTFRLGKSYFTIKGGKILRVKMKRKG